ncbi:unnamed protein product [Cylindrotheca closterium]|uniref:Uncharacterized protein n=1 Tax=Cylindrotheca closterium TaxID=2856 RepID=A0AAD2GA89_9STRA|nr:unnamed protein product [Cylindrotheca closterium]
MISLRRRVIDRRNEDERYVFRKHQKEIVPTVAIRRRTVFFAFLVVISQYAAVDSVNMLPAIILFYSMGLAISFELMSGEPEMFGLTILVATHDDASPLDNVGNILMDPEEEFRHLLGLAQFEYFVLKKRPQTKFARVPDQEGNFKLFVV